MTPNKTILFDYEDYPIPRKYNSARKDAFILVVGVGKARVTFHNGTRANDHQVVISNVMYAPTPTPTFFPYRY